jgi:hypothetical protein
MKVKELMEQLSTFDPETEVICSYVDHTDYTYKLPVAALVLDSPYDSNGYSGIDGTEIDEDGYDDHWDEEGEYIGPNKALVIVLDGVE